jgi:uroporphyrinogen decarboxylase
MDFKDLKKGSSVKHRDRVLMALNHETPDRCPMHISFTPEFADRLRADMQVKVKSAYNPHGGGNTYEMERALGEDLILTSIGWANSYYQQEGDYVDEWGIAWRSVNYTTPFGTGRYTEPMGHPLAEEREIDHYKAPDPHRPQLYQEAQRVIEKFKDEYWIVGVTVTTIFETATALRGYMQILKDIVASPELFERLLEIPYRYHLAAARRLVEMGVDMIWLGDDVGGQTNMLISPSHWRKFLKPRLASFIYELKAINPQVNVAYHSDGAIEPIISDLIEIGLDVLNPIQPACMDPSQLKKRYGNNLCFWGSIDEQHTLPFGTPAEVKAEVLLRLKTLGKGGGLIIGPTHHVQLDTPMENFWTMVNTITGTAYESLAEY